MPEQDPDQRPEQTLAVGMQGQKSCPHRPREGRVDHQLDSEGHARKKLPQFYLLEGSARPVADRVHEPDGSPGAAREAEGGPADQAEARSGPAGSNLLQQAAETASLPSASQDICIEPCPRDAARCEQPSSVPSGPGDGRYQSGPVRSGDPNPVHEQGWSASDPGPSAVPDVRLHLAPVLVQS